MDTYQSTGSCELSERQHQRICDKATITRTEQQETRGRFEKDKVSCHRRKVILRAREAEDLETDTFAMRQCKYSEYSYFHSYFVGKSHLRDVAILYRSPTEKNPIKLDANIVYLQEIIIDINN